jgi:hypothetical protein
VHDIPPAAENQASVVRGIAGIKPQNQFKVRVGMAPVYAFGI